MSPLKGTYFMFGLGKVETPIFLCLFRSIFLKDFLILTNGHFQNI